MGGRAMSNDIPLWQINELEYDLAREQARREARMYARRDRNFWTPIGVALMIIAPLTVALIEGSL